MNVDNAFELPIVQIAISCLDIAFELGRWRGGREKNGAACRIAAEQRSLRPLPHLHRGQIELRHEAAEVRIGQQIGRAQVRTPATYAQLASRLMLEKHYTSQYVGIHKTHTP